MEEELRAALGLPETADREAILTAVTAAHAASTSQAAMMARLTQAAGVAGDATADQLVAAINARRSGDDPEKAALQDQVKALSSRLDRVVTAHATEKAVSIVDKAIGEGRIVPALRDRYIARHIKEPAEVEAEIRLLPAINAGGLGHRAAIDAGDGASIAGTDAEVVELMGLDPKAFAAQSKLMKESL